MLHLFSMGGRSAARRQYNAALIWYESFTGLAFGPQQAYVLAYARTNPMIERHVKLFRNGRNQAVRIPREFELPGEDAIMRKEGPRLVIEPTPRKSLVELLDSWEPIDDEFPDIDDLPPLDDVEL